MRSRRLILVILIISVLTLSAAIAAPFGKSRPSLTPLSNLSPTPSPTGDPFLNCRKKDFTFNECNFKNICIVSCGRKFEFCGYEESPCEILIPLSDRNTDLLLDLFGVNVSFDRVSQQIIFTRGKESSLVMKTDCTSALFNGELKQIPVPARIIKGNIYISPNSFSRFIWACFLFDENRCAYFLDPFLLDVKLETSKEGLTKVVAKGTGPLSHRILKLRQPTRFVIDVMNVCLDGKSRQIEHPQLGAIRFSQFELKGEEGNIVRIVIPESEDYEVVMADSRAPNFVEAQLRPRNSLAPVQDLAIQKIKDIKIDESPSQVAMTIETTGPVQMEWNRLLPPDDRFFLDIPGTLFPEKKHDYKLKSDFLPEIRVAQFTTMPNPKVRFVLPLEGPKKVDVQYDERKPSIVKVVISKNEIDPSKEQRKGFLFTSFAANGLIVCIDPGHGGSDAGAVNRTVGVYEKQITLDIAKRLNALLKKEGWTVAMTRAEDRDVSYPGSPDYEELGARTSVANDLRAHLFVSIHINAAVNRKVSGFSTYWYKNEDKTLAQCVQQSMISCVDCNDLGIRRERFFVVRNARMPAILVEAGFISNHEEARLLNSPEFRQKIAESIMRGVKAYAKSNGLKSRKK